MCSHPRKFSVNAFPCCGQRNRRVNYFLIPTKMPPVNDEFAEDTSDFHKIRLSDYLDDSHELSSPIRWEENYK